MNYLQAGFRIRLGFTRIQPPRKKPDTDPTFKKVDPDLDLPFLPNKLTLFFFFDIIDIITVSLHIIQ